QTGGEGEDGIEEEGSGWSARFRGEEDTTIGEFGAVVGHVVDLDHAWRDAGFNDVELRLVGRKGKTVRPVDVTGGDGGTPGLGVEAIDVGWQLRCCHMSLVVAEDAEWRGGEPDFVVRFDDDGIW